MDGLTLVVASLGLVEGMAIIYFLSQYFFAKREILEMGNLLEKERKLREEERAGRINSQLRARTILKESQLSDGFNFVPIAIVESPFANRCGTPRQPTLVKASRGRIKFNSKLIQYEHYKELEQFSHLWVIWIFHENTNTDSQRISAKICPPRLHGEKVYNCNCDSYSPPSSQ